MLINLEKTYAQSNLKKSEKLYQFGIKLIRWVVTFHGGIGNLSRVHVLTGGHSRTCRWTPTNLSSNLTGVQLILFQVTEMVKNVHQKVGQLSGWDLKPERIVWHFIYLQKTTAS